GPGLADMIGESLFDVIEQRRHDRGVARILTLQPAGGHAQHAGNRPHGDRLDTPDGQERDGALGNSIALDLSLASLQRGSSWRLFRSPRDGGHGQLLTTPRTAAAAA